ncbi:MAG TPA: hypothetical protein VIL30_14395 [Ramlibacter sp.]
MAKFLELLKASIRRERQWADTRLDAGDGNFTADAETAPQAPPQRGQMNFAATVPMQLGRF